jgi:serine phosphatase RsbU (regulator of sigma subunit)
MLVVCDGLWNPTASQNKQLPDEVETQIKNLEVNAIKNRNAGNDNAAVTYLNKVAFLYWEYFIYEEAVKYFDQVLSINHSLGNKNGEQKVLENMAFVYTDMERFDKSIEYFSQSLKIVNEKGNKPEIAMGLSNLALAYNNNGQYNEAIANAEKGLELSKELNNMKLLRSFYGILHESYDKKGDKDKATEYFGLYSTIDKHIQQQLFKERESQNQRDLSEMSEQKNVAIQQKEQKEKELVKTQDTLKQSQLEVDLLNAENEAKEAKIKAKEAALKAERRLLYSILIAFGFVCLLTLLIYKQMREKKRANKKLLELYEEIEKKNNQILDSINYASHIQEAILPYETHLQEDFPNSFVFYKPRDIVSGDFYWHSRHKDLVFVAAIDCTGHGVPGAFMSMIGNTLLNEIVNEKEVFEPAKVLQLLNEKVEFTLNQNNGDKHGFSEDGMDITFCCYNKTTNTLQIALANHSAIYFADGKVNIIEGGIYSIGGNVGIGKSIYNNYDLEIKSDTSLYLFSDGYQDQFGGTKNQKYMTPRFISFLEEIQNKPFNQHKSLLENEYNTWKGDSKQIDDVLVIGVKFMV